eukprot:1160729-Pelagomonas_calceolata.AAC.6
MPLRAQTHPSCFLQVPKDVCMFVEIATVTVVCPHCVQCHSHWVVATTTEQPMGFGKKTCLFVCAAACVLATFLLVMAAIPSALPCKKSQNCAPDPGVSPEDIQCFYIHVQHHHYHHHHYFHDHPPLIPSITTAATTNIIIVASVVPYRAVGQAICL